MIKQIQELKNELCEMGLYESPPPKVTQPSFLRTDLGEDEVNGHGEKEDLPIENQ